jgi:hypothetical protein
MLHHCRLVVCYHFLNGIAGYGVFVDDDDGFNRIVWYLDSIMLVEKEDEEKIEESAGAPTPVRRTTDKPISSSITVDPTTLNEKEEFQLKEAIKKAMLDEKGQDKGYFTIGEVTSLLTTLPQTNWTESKVDRVIQEWYDKGRLMERQEIGKYTPV